MLGSFHIKCMIYIFQVHVWAGISSKGAKNVCIFTGYMESVGYQTILKRNLLPLKPVRWPSPTYILTEEFTVCHR